MVQQKQQIWIHPLFTDYGCTKDGTVISFKSGEPKEIKLVVSQSKGYLIFAVYLHGRQYVLRAHRFILECIDGTIPEDLQTDHINGDVSDCSYQNLRLVTHSVNQGCKRKKANTSSKYKGVCWFRGRWRASIRHHSIGYFLGYFDREEDAARCYDSYSKKMQTGFKTNYEMGLLN